MRGEHLGADFGGDHPVAGDGHVADEGWVLVLLLFPAAEIYRAGEWGHHDELGEGYAGFQGHFHGGVEGGRLVGGQAEDERAEDVDAVLLEGLELFGERFAGVVPVFVNGFQAFGGDGFDAYQSTLDIGLVHGVEILAVFACFHGDLGEEDHVFGQFGELFHELETLLAHGCQLVQFCLVVLLSGEAQVGEGDGIEVVVGEGDEAEADLAEVDDFIDDALELALAWLLAVGAPDTAEGAVLGASSDGLDGGPHVLAGLHEVPARGQELAAFDAAAFVDALGFAFEAVGDAATPGDVSVAFDYGVGFAAFEGFSGEKRGVDAAVDDPCAAGAGHATHLIAAQSVAGVDADADDVAGLDAFGDDLFEGLIDEDGIAGDAGCGCGEDKEPSWRDDRGSKRIVAGVYETYTHWGPTFHGPNTAG